MAEDKEFIFAAPSWSPEEHHLCWKISFFGRASLAERCAETGKGCVCMYGCPEGMKIFHDLHGMAGVKAVWQQNLCVHRLQVELSQEGEMISWFAFLCSSVMQPHQAVVSQGL